MRDLRLSDRILDGAVFVLAGWTVIANAYSLGGGTFRGLAATALGVAILAGLFLFVRLRNADEEPEDAAPPPPVVEHDVAPDVWLRVAGVVAAIVCVAFVRESNDLNGFWLGATVLALFGASIAVRATPVCGAAASGPALDRTLLACSIACAAVTLFAHRTDLDDSFYVNVAVTVADRPEDPLFAYDTLHGLRELPLMLPVYKVQSIELLVGALSWTTGIPAIWIAHVVFPFIAAMLVPLALARLFRRLLPDRWILGVLLTLAFFLLVGSPNRSYGNFAFVRLYQGKSIFQSAMLPLLFAYALEFAVRPTRMGWLRLAAAQVAALGLTVTSIWMAPAVVGLALVSGSAPRLSSVRNVAVGMLSCAYVLGIGLLLRAETSAILSQYEFDQPETGLFRQALRFVLGRSPITDAALFALLAAWAFARSGLLRRFATIVPLGFLLVLWNPFAAPFLASNVTGDTTYWRVFWVPAVPILLATVLAAPLDSLPRVPVRASIAAGVVAAGLLFALGPDTYTLSRDNDVSWGLPGPNVERGPYDAAVTLARLAPGGKVLAPMQVSSWVPTVHHHPSPMMVKLNHLRTLRVHLGDEETNRRVALTRLVSGFEDARPAAPYFAAALPELDAVCIVPQAEKWPEVVNALRKAGFERVEANQRYAFWVRRR